MMKKGVFLLLAIILAVTAAIDSFSPVLAQSAPPLNPDTAWQPPEDDSESVAPSIGVEIYNQNYPGLQIMPAPSVPAGPGEAIVNAYIVNSYGQILSTLRGNEICYLVLSINSPGYFYLWEYYPSGSTPYGHWIYYRWYRPSAGVWRIGPFQAEAWDRSGRYIWKLWFQSGGYWSTRTLSYSYIRSYYPGEIITMPTPQPVYPPSIDSFTSNISNIDLGQVATLTWRTSDATGVTITPGIGAVSSSGSTAVSPTTTTTYTLTASGQTGNPVSAHTTITIAPKVAPSFNANQATIGAGKSTTLTWNAPSATNVNIAGIGSFASSGSAQVTSEKTTSYMLTASYPDGATQTAWVTVFVEQPPYLLYGLIGLLAICAAVITVLLLRKPRPAPVAPANESGTRAAASTAAATSTATESPATSAVEAPPARLVMPDGSEMLLAGNNRSFGRQDFDKFLSTDKRSYISRQHINIWYEDGHYYIEDRSSTNGTQLNGTDITGDGRHAIAEGDIIELAGKLSITFKT